MLGKVLGQISIVITTIDDFVWGIPLIVLILSVGIYLTIRLKGLQITKMPMAIRHIRDNEKTGEHGEVSSFGALCTALSATIGTGNIVGVATALVAGGPGALFWMWLAALLGTATKYSECLLSIKYRVVAEDGHIIGGPFYYIEKGMGKNWKWLAKIFAFFGVGVGLFGIGTFTQVNGITSAVKNFFDPDSQNTVHLFGTDYSIAVVIAGLIITVCVALVIIGGLKRISRVAEVIVPFMAVLYVAVALIILICNITRIPGAIVEIVQGAFGVRAAAGGALGAMMIAMQKGIARGIFSNEAGLGTGSIAHACADTSKPVKQGFFGIFEVFVDTIVICTLTALVILCSGVPVGYGQAAGAELTISGFTSTYGGWVSIFTAVAMCCFAFSTVIGWGLYGQRCIEFLFGPKATKPFMAAYSLVAVVGATMNLGLMWSIAETFNGLMVIPNLIAVFLLSNTVVQLLKDYFNGEGKIK